MIKATICVFFCFLARAPALKSGIVGDAVPPSYPVVNVHVPEGGAGDLEQRLASEDAAGFGRTLDELAEQQQSFRKEMLEGIMSCCGWVMELNCFWSCVS